MKSAVQILDMVLKAREASSALANTDSKTKSMAINFMAEHLENNIENVLKANKIDMDNLKDDVTEAFSDRLFLDEKRVRGIAFDLRKIASLPDPVGRVLNEKTLENGLVLKKVSVPIGVISVIYESRPNVTADAGALCMKSGNAVILRGGSESFNSSMAIMDSLKYGLEKAGLSKDCISMVPTTDREVLNDLIKMDNHIDLLIPRGGKGLLSFIKENSKIPLLLHLDGLCHTYVHKDADLKKTLDIVLNAKMRRTGVCNATETILIDEDIILTHLKPMIDMLIDNGCEVRGDSRVKLVDNRVKKATLEDWSTEYLDAIVSIKVVANIEKAIAHIDTYSSNHTDAIITENKEMADKFLKEVKSAVVMWNTSTQFCDGGQFGMGAEIGISTGKLHARGPVGLEELNTYKYNVIGNGQIRPK